MNAILKIIEPIGILRGFTHGIRQPCAVGRFRVREGAGLPASVADVLGLPLGDANHLNSIPNEVDAIARGLLDAYIYLSWHARIPVHEKVTLSRGPITDGWIDYYFVVGSWNIDATRALLIWIQTRFNEALLAGFSAKKVDVSEVMELLKPHAFSGVNAFSVVLAALRTGCTVHRLSKSICVLGTGIHSRWVRSLSTDRTSSMSIGFAQRKTDTAKLLREGGLPGAVHLLVTNAKDALKAASTIGFPVVVKPSDQEQGRGVASGLMNPAQVVHAFEAAAKYGSGVLVERHAKGFTHRLTVTFGEVIRVVRRVPGGVTGDGVSSIRNLLLAQEQTDLWRQRVRVTGLSGPKLDAEAHEMLSLQDLTPESVVASNQFVPLRRRDNFSAGGTNVYLSLEDVHPDNLRMAKDAATLLRLEMAGIDFITTDITKSWLTHGGMVCEVNALPQFYAANDDPIYKTILKRMFPNGSEVPAILYIVNDNPTSEQIENAVREVTRYKGNVVATTSGLYVDGLLATSRFNSGFEAARAALIRQDTQAVICFLTVTELLNYGLPCAKWVKVRCSDDVALKWPSVAAGDQTKLKYLLAGIHVEGLQL